MNDLRPAGDGQLEVQIRGLDVYDPITGAVRSSSVDDIAANEVLRVVGIA